MLESKFQGELIPVLESMFPGCVVIKNDPNYLQGIPDLLVLYKAKWAMLEAKNSFFARRQPNQPYYVDLFDKMSFGAFICPENKEEVLGALQSAFRSQR